VRGAETKHVAAQLTEETVEFLRDPLASPTVQVSGL
jgi:hypothetical protein